MRKILSLMLCFCWLLPLPAGAEQADAPLFPDGIWVLSGMDTWRYNLREDVPLSPDALLAAEALGLPVEGGMLTSGTSLLEEDLPALFPQAEAQRTPPLIKPELAPFSLHGEWFYGADDTLYYDHGEGYSLMTEAEVFSALTPTIAEGNPPAKGDKTIYLTIDDAPSPLTMELLSVLHALNVKATFFLVGGYVRNYPVYTRAIYEQGHALANHSYTHDAQILSSSFAACLKDFQRAERVVEEALGFPYPMPILRIPYGAATVPVGFRTKLQEQGYAWVDWNALNGDSEPQTKSDQDTLSRAFSTAARNNGDIVLLVHDNKIRTIRTLPALVAHFRQAGYVFRPLTMENLTKIEGVRMGLPKDQAG